MKVALVDVDGHSNFPNLALLRLSAWHKARGDDVEWWNGFTHYDRVYLSKRNIGEVYQLLAMSSEKELNALFDVLPVTHPAKAPYSIFKQSSESVRGGVIIGLGSRLQVFQNQDIRNITGYDEIDLELPGNHRFIWPLVT